MLGAARENVEKSFLLLEKYDKNLYGEILAEEENIDKLTDRVSHYIVELLPHLQLEQHVAILNQYYKVTTEFERLGDHAVSIAEIASNLAHDGTSFSSIAADEIHVVESVLHNILENTELTFRERDEKAAQEIEPLVQIVNELNTVLRRNHLRRLSLGQCSMYADIGFTNLCVEFRRIAAVCSNVGVATVVRIHPELADHEHLYFERLHNGDDAAFKAAYEKAYACYFSRLSEEAPTIVSDTLSYGMA